MKISNPVKSIDLKTNIDIVFLLFLLMITQGSMPMKVFGLFFIIIFKLKPILNVKMNILILFYVCIFLYSILYGYILTVLDLRYIANYLFTLFLWFTCITCFIQINHFIRSNSIEIIKNTLEAYFFICLIVIFIQYILAVIEYNHLNPFIVTQSAGDLFKSIFANSSVNMIIMSFFALFFYFNKRKAFAILAAVSMLLTGFMSGIILFCASLLATSFLLTKRPITKKLGLILVFIFAFICFLLISPQNISYSAGYLERIARMEGDVPFKILSFKETISYWVSSIRSFLLGAGPGNFSSRVAFIISGDYVSWFPEHLIYIGEEFKTYHFSLWTHDFNNPWDNRENTANQPFSFYNQLIGEYGLIGISSFIFFYLGYYMKNYRFLTFSKYLLIALLGYFILDYWFEYFSVIIVFELLTLLDIKKQKNINENILTNSCEGAN